MIWPFVSLTVEDLMAETLTSAHAYRLAEIHKKTFTPSWTDGDFMSMLEKPTTGGVLLRLPYDRGGNVAGFAMVRAAADEAEILTIAVDPSWQHRGVGRRLMDIVIANLQVDGIGSLFLEVDQNNKAAVALYKRSGFEQVAVRENYYATRDGAKSNALVMRRDVG